MENFGTVGVGVVSRNGCLEGIADRIGIIARVRANRMCIANAEGAKHDEICMCGQRYRKGVPQMSAILPSIDANRPLSHYPVHGVSASILGSGCQAGNTVVDELDIVMWSCSALLRVSQRFRIQSYFRSICVAVSAPPARQAMCWSECN